MRYQRATRGQLEDMMWSEGVAEEMMNEPTYELTVQRKPRKFL
jgi:hypothetical protein